MLYLFGPSMTTAAYVWAHVIIVGIFIMILAYHSLVYWMDRMIITNQRVVYINWKHITVRDEDETELNDIQDIHTKERGLLAAIDAFDYGVFKLQTASHTTAITFDDAPDPEGIRQYIYSIKPN